MRKKDEKNTPGYKVQRIGSDVSTLSKWYSSTTGSLSHCASWIFSPKDKKIYKNPAYEKTDEKQEDVFVYCTHGTADQPTAFQKMVNYLIDEGKLPQNIHSIHLMDFKGRYKGKGIKWFAEQLVEKILQNNHKRVILFGHSRGGLVNAYMAEFLAAEYGITVEALFHFGAPFGSSYLAIWPLTLFSTSVEQMAPESKFLADLNNAMEKSVLKHYFYVAGQDIIVWKEAAVAKHYAVNREKAVSLSQDSELPCEDTESSRECCVIIMEKHSHISMMTSYEIVADVRENIKRSLTAPEKGNSDTREHDNPALMEQPPIEEVTITIHDNAVIIDDYPGCSSSPGSSL
ncbi:esterase/lipase family protein [Legionella spiritensis]|uniref:Putative lipase n=1 Tax=Legionella spiritensis TaxID=452 RepID=A0A0W0YYR4_LEGSP|nr:alpha/beta hydrolase [Legionella spiritensis]KTD62053.1 putative lipase [Legionella spiritensis]SNV34474.1 putative lipase [Legionella spiritensis]